MNVQTCLLSDVITSGIELLFHSHNAIDLRRGQQECCGVFRPAGVFKFRALWSVRDGKGLTKIGVSQPIFIDDPPYRLSWISVQWELC